MIKFFLTISIVFFFSESFSQTIPVIKTQRPRLEINSERFNWLKTNISGGDSGASYKRFKNSYDTNWITDSQVFLAGSDASKWNFNWKDRDAHMLSKMTAFLLQMGTDKLAQKRCEFIIGKYITYLNTLNFNDYSGDVKETLLRKNCDYGGVLLDWTYDYMPQTLRKNLSVSLYRVLEYFMREYILTPSGNSYVSSHNIYNCIVTMRAALALHGADGLSSSQKSNVDSWYRTLVNKWENGILPAFAYFRDKDGGWNWSAGYSMLNLDRQYQFFDDMLYATGKNYYEEQPWIRESINQYWYYLRPDNYSIHWGDAIIKFNRGDRVLYRHAAEFEDARSQYLVQVYDQPQYLSNSTLVFFKLMYKDFTAPYQPHPKPPLSWCANRVGLSVSRTSWDEDATMVWFCNNPVKKTDHEHRDNNSFSIIKDKPLILDAGTYDYLGSSHYNNYYSRTIAHNTVCVYDRTDAYRNLGRSVSNDGGQIESDRLSNLTEVFSPEHKRGEWLNHVCEDDYSYQIADAAASYHSDKLDRFERRLLFHKPDKVIVLDHLHLLNTNSEERKAKYINHFANRPEINGSIVKTQVPNHIVTYNGKDYKTTYGKGSVAIRTLLPESSTTTLVGGNGYEYWVDGKNYPPAGGIDLDIEHPGHWRIEVEPTKVQEDLVYLHTIKIGDNQKLAAPGGKLYKNATTLGIDWDNYLYFFNAKGSMENEKYVVNNINGGRTIEIFALDLKKNTSFGVFIDGVLQKTGKSTSKGVFQQTVNLPSGSSSVLIQPSTESKSGTDDSSGSDSNSDSDSDSDSPLKGLESFDVEMVRVFPNPTNGRFTISIENDEVSEFPIHIFDSTGRKVFGFLNSSNRANVDLGELSSGVYFLMINYLDKIVKKKIVLVH